MDVGNETIGSIERMIEAEKANVKTIECPGCKKQIEEGVQFCKYCGFDLSRKADDKQNFEEEFRRRYKESVQTKRKRFIFTLSSIGVLTLLVIFSVYFGVSKLIDYYNSEEYKIKTVLKEWESSWENKDIEKYKNLLDKDYIYYDKDGKAVRLDEKIKRMQWTFDTYKKINLKISDIKIKTDSTSPDYVNVSFKQVYTSDKKEETGTKTLRMYKGEETGFKWKIFREYFE